MGLNCLGGAERQVICSKLSRWRLPGIYGPYGNSGSLTIDVTQHELLIHAPGAFGLEALATTKVLEGFAGPKGYMPIDAEVSIRATPVGVERNLSFDVSLIRQYKSPSSRDEVGTWKVALDQESTSDLG